LEYFQVAEGAQENPDVDLSGITGDDS
jgi:hypothetical protein